MDSYASAETSDFAALTGALTASNAVLELVIHLIAMEQPGTHLLNVWGTPKPQGSKRAFVNKHTGKAQMTESGGEKLADWRYSVSACAMNSRNKPDMPIERAVLLTEFRLKRPKKHYYQRKSGLVLREDAPVLHFQKPDSDKLDRAVRDSLTQAGWLSDDCVIARSVTEKRWVDRENETEGATMLVVRV